MSLILDALKKAEKEGQPQQKNRVMSPNPIVSDKLGISKRRTLLLIGLVISAVFLIYSRLFKKAPVNPTPPQPIAAISNPITTKNPTELKTKATELFQQNKLSESKVLWEKLTLLLPTDAEIYNNLGLVLKKMGKKDEAYQAYSQALALKKDYPEALNNLGVLLISDGAKDKAKTHFQKAIELTKDYADPYFNLALLFEQEGNVKEASQHYRHFLELAPQTEKELRKKIEEKISILERQ